jgi:hypothetical protein
MAGGRRLMDWGNTGAGEKCYASKMTTSQPPYSDPAHVVDALRTDGYALLRPQDVAALAGCSLDELQALAPSWNHLELDNYLKDGGSALVQSPHRAHWQPVEYNALHGGMHRLFVPIEPATVERPAWHKLLRSLGEVCSRVKGAQTWYVEAHQFRIDTADGIGRPTPEGAHRDGVDFVAVILIGREGIKGGETRVFEADGPKGQRFTMLESWTMLLLDDAAVIHESTPIQPLGEHGHRDTLVLTWRAGEFQGG